MIRLVEDVGAPVAVAAIDILTSEMAPDYNEMASYIMTGAGYLGGFFLKGTTGDFMTRMGAASLPLTARAIRERIKQPVTRRAGVANQPRLVLRNVPGGTPVSRSYDREFESVTPHAF